MYPGRKTPSSEPSYSPEKPGRKEGEFVISKKVITERDLIAAKEQKVCCVVVDQKAILTDLAREYAGKQKITIQRGCLGSSKGGRTYEDRKVIGNIWATRKEERLAGLKLLVIQPIDLLDDSPIEYPIVAADIIGAGVGKR